MWVGLCNGEWYAFRISLIEFHFESTSSTIGIDLKISLQSVFDEKQQFFFGISTKIRQKDGYL